MFKPSANDHGTWARGMLDDFLKRAKKSKDQRAEMIHYVDGKLTVEVIELKDFDWNHFDDIVAISFLLVTDNPKEQERVLFSPSLRAFQASFGEPFEGSSFVGATEDES
jgi:hypothetical protein